MYFLAWTTTPWTLPGNTALAVDGDAEYSMVRLDSGDKLVLASALLGDVVREPYTLLDTFQGKELVGFSYEPLYDPTQHGVEVSTFHGGQVFTPAQGKPQTYDCRCGFRLYGGWNGDRAHRTSLW